jgi:dienelactone hydrolase
MRGGEPLFDRLASGVGLALRSGVTPLMLGLRMAGQRSLAKAKHSALPAARRGLRLAGKVALDEIFFASELLLAPFVSAGDRERLAREIGEARALYEARGFDRDPTRFHPRPPALRNVEIRRRHARFGSFHSLRFASEYEPHPGEPGRERWLAQVPNRQAGAWLLEHRGKRRPWVVCVPGYRMGHPLVDFTGFRARWLHQVLGLNVAIAVMPLHGPRRSGWRGGDGFLTGDFVDTIHAQAQAVWDLRRLIEWLRADRAPAVAVQGVSLGGYTAALLTGLERELDAVIVGVPTTDLVGLLRDNATPALVRGLAKLGLPIDDIEAALRVVSPLALAPRVPRERLFLFAGLADHLAPPDHAHALWRHWGEPRALWYQGGHVSFVFEPAVKGLIEEAFRSCELLPEAERDTRASSEMAAETRRSQAS